MSQQAPSRDRRTLLALLDASAAILSKADLDQMLHTVAEQAAAVLNAEGASVLLLDEQRNELVFRAATGPKAEALLGQRFDRSLGIAGQAARTRRAVRVDDVRSNRNFFEGVDAKTHMQTRGLIAAPLIHLDSVVGVVEVINPAGKPHFADGDVDLLQLFANLAAAAVRRGQADDLVRRNNLGLRQAMPSPTIIGHASSIEQVIALCRRVAPSTATVLITGETGTGKELVARAIHEFSKRSDKPLIAINCAALPETLLESELFGHEKGAFTGATDRKLGRFELADGGTLFLDELGEMSKALQVKLLRVLQERELVRLGGTKTVTCDVRVVAATHHDLKKEMATGRFRSDLYYRLHVFPIHLPPLRDRLEDVPRLVEHFLNLVVPSLGIAAVTVDPATVEALGRYDWPGNIRELRNVIERAALLAVDGRITLQQLPAEIAEMAPASSDRPDPPATMSKLGRQEQHLILQALDQTGWNQSAAARSLGISRDQLRYRMGKYHLERPEPGSDAPPAGD